MFSSPLEIKLIQSHLLDSKFHIVFKYIQWETTLNFHSFSYPLIYLFGKLMLFATEEGMAKQNGKLLRKIGRLDRLTLPGLYKLKLSNIDDASWLNNSINTYFLLWNLSIFNFFLTKNSIM